MQHCDLEFREFQIELLEGAELVERYEPGIPKGTKTALSAITSWLKNMQADLAWPIPFRIIIKKIGDKVNNSRNVALLQNRCFIQTTRNNFWWRRHQGLDVYAGRTGEKIGTIDNALVDGVRSFPVFVVDTGFGFWQEILLPVIAKLMLRRGILCYSEQKQVEELPEYNEVRRLRATMKS